MLMNRVQPRRPPGTSEATGGIPRSAPSSSQPELTAGVAPFQGESPELGATLGGTDYGALPMPPLPPPPPGSNLPFALDPAPQAASPSRSMVGGGVPQGATDLFGGGGGGAQADPAFLQQILAGLPGGRG